MTLLILLTCWLLFALPVFLFAAGVLGARLYAMGQHQQVPALVPRFAISRGAQANNGESGGKRERLPDV